MANLIRFWVGAGDTKVSLTPFDASQLQGQPLFFEVPAQPMPLPVRTGKTVKLVEMTVREWIVSLLKDTNGVKTHQTWVELDLSLLEQKFRKSDSRPYRSLDLTREDMVPTLVYFIESVWANTTVKVTRGEAAATKASEALSGMTFK
jgi:hypothetical protein